MDLLKFAEFELNRLFDSKIPENKFRHVQTRVVKMLMDYACNDVYDDEFRFCCTGCD